MSPLHRPASRHIRTRPATVDRKDTPAAAPTQPHPTPPDPSTDAGHMAEPVLYTADQAAQLLQVRPSWLRRKAASRAVPCRHVGKHLRFSRADIHAIADNSAQPARRNQSPYRS